MSLPQYTDSSSLLQKSTEAAIHWRKLGFKITEMFSRFAENTLLIYLISTSSCTAETKVCSAQNTGSKVFHCCICDRAVECGLQAERVLFEPVDEGLADLWLSAQVARVIKQKLSYWGENESMRASVDAIMIRYCIRCSRQRSAEGGGNHKHIEEKRFRLLPRPLSEVSCHPVKLFHICEAWKL